MRRGIYRPLSNSRRDGAGQGRKGEYARDAAQLGFAKALIIIGHIASEKEGMRLLAERMSQEIPSLESRYFECGEAYTAP